MGFAVDLEFRNDIEFVILRNENNQEYVEIIPQIGATVNKIQLSFNNELINILYNDSDKELLNNPAFRGRLLFPFNDMIPNAKYTFNGKEYTLDPTFEFNTVGMHGFAHNKKFDIVNKEVTKDYASVNVRYKIDDKDANGYPFNLTLIIVYTLYKHKFSIDILIENNGIDMAPISPGWHPYFRFGGNIDNANLKMNSDTYVEVDKDLIPTRNHVKCEGTIYDFKNGKEISDLEIDTALSVPKDGTIRLSQNGKMLIIEQDPNFFKYVQLYIPRDRDSIAIEPVCGATNSFNFHELGVVSLKRNKKVKSTISVSADQNE